MYPFGRKGNPVRSGSIASKLVRCAAVFCIFSFLTTSVAAQLPDSPGTLLSNSGVAEAKLQRTVAPTEVAQAAAPQNASQQTDTKPSGQQPSPAASPTQQSSGSQQQPAPAGQKPVGTAAAESVLTSGVAASQPAGTAIAPGKQRRTRSIVIKVGALVGAGVAVGTVAALTRCTSSKPPGAR